MLRLPIISLVAVLALDGCMARMGFADMVPAGDGEFVFGDGRPSGSNPLISFTEAQTTIDEVSGIDGVPWHAGFDAWAHRLELGLAIDSNSELLADFPLLVTLDPLRFPYAECAADGRDLRFVARDGTHLAFEIDRWDPIGTSRLWVRAPQVGRRRRRPLPLLWQPRGRC